MRQKQRVKTRLPKQLARVNHNKTALAVFTRLQVLPVASKWSTGRSWHRYLLIVFHRLEHFYRNELYKLRLLLLSIAFFTKNCFTLFKNCSNKMQTGF